MGIAEPDQLNLIASPFALWGLRHGHHSASARVALGEYIDNVVPDAPEFGDLPIDAFEDRL